MEENLVVRRNMEDLESERIQLVKIADGVFTSRNPFQDVLLEDGILVHCMKHCIKGGCVIYEVKIKEPVSNCEVVNLAQKVEIVRSIGIAKSSISLYAMREISRKASIVGLEEAVSKILNKMREGMPECV
ncbi:MULTISPECIES: hypothetical protein [Metallosphaera]|uniref:Uncharacterized protein n=3 Tax=Metallosphaera TaxID=41980 RepID=A4YDT5_METS5|nr:MULTISPECIES: hypothetical protein [Metallosphaera]ABP94587.1 hypothetical protein Msed_0410 [Metallosphaera sedula DSM 5348]AIM26574.1 hypothetical protein HA72_0410 [Metallosphaera sedula]AKV73557.1 hypothetical protein MsedA_0423 [Metallosphaera sedula]AKV75799.1 hypothetical protein MsedB_0423 [Metallosphaera sedula]AKV78047.1 hypothetical protein MsedC_0422 [Metallosphaera sedula]